MKTNVEVTESEIMQTIAKLREELAAARRLIITLTIIIGVMAVAIALNLKSDSKFVSEYEPYSDGWCIEYTQHTHPLWTAQQCEDYVFMTESDFANKYR